MSISLPELGQPTSTSTSHTNPPPLLWVYSFRILYHHWNPPSKYFRSSPFTIAPPASFITCSSQFFVEPIRPSPEGSLRLWGSCSSQFFFLSLYAFPLRANKHYASWVNAHLPSPYHKMVDLTHFQLAPSSHESSRVWGLCTTCTGSYEGKNNSIRDVFGAHWTFEWIEWKCQPSCTIYCSFAASANNKLSAYHHPLRQRSDITTTRLCYRSFHRSKIS